MMGRLKWNLILYWNQADKTVRSGAPDPDSDDDDLGAWSRCKRVLTRRWTSELKGTAPVGVTDASLEEGRGNGLGLISDGVSGLTELLALPATENAENLPGGMLRLPLSPGSRARQLRASTQRSSMERPTSKASKASSAARDSGILIEEEALSWLQEFGRRSQEIGRRSQEITGKMGATGTRQDYGDENRRGSV